MKNTYCTPEIIIRKYDLCEEISESGGEDPNKKEEIDNKYYVILQCATMLEKYYERARELDNGNSNSMTLESEDLKKWQVRFYPALVESKIIQNGDYFDAANPESFGIKKDGTFTKLGFCHFAYRCYKTLIKNSHIVETYIPLYNFCCSLDEDVELFRGNAYNCSEQRHIKKMDLWNQGVYEEYSKTNIIEDSTFFNGGDSNPDYGIGADGLYDKQELIHFLYRAFRYIYSFCAYHSDMVFCGINLNEDMVSRCYTAAEEGIIKSICFLDPICSKVKYSNDVNGFTDEYIYWKNKNNSFEGFGEMSNTKFEIIVKENKLVGIIFNGENDKKTQSLNRKGRLLDYWIGTYSYNDNSLCVKDYNTILWNGKIIPFEYDEIKNSFKQLECYEDTIHLSGNFHHENGKNQLSLSIKDLITKNVVSAKFIVEKIVGKKNLQSELSVPQYQYGSQLYMCVLCNLFYHPVDCYIVNKDTENTQFLATIPAQGVTNIFLPLDIDICFVTGQYIFNAYRIKENENYVLLGNDEDFDRVCSVELNGFSYFSYKTKFDPIDVKEKGQQRSIYLHVEENSAFLMIKFEKYIVCDGHNSDIYITDPKAGETLINNMSGFSSYTQNWGGILIIDNPSVGEWEIKIPDDSKIEMAISGQVMPSSKEGFEAREQYDLAISALRKIYDYPEQKYAEMLSPVNSAMQKSNASNGARLLGLGDGGFLAPVIMEGATGCISSVGCITILAIGVVVVAIGVVVYFCYYNNNKNNINKKTGYSVNNILNELPADGTPVARNFCFNNQNYNWYIRYFSPIICDSLQKNKIKVLCIYKRKLSRSCRLFKTYFDMLSLAFYDSSQKETAIAFDLYCIETNWTVEESLHIEFNKYHKINYIIEYIDNKDSEVGFASAGSYYRIKLNHSNLCEIPETAKFADNYWKNISNIYNTSKYINTIIFDEPYAFQSLKFEELCKDHLGKFKEFVDSYIGPLFFGVLAHEFLHTIEMYLQKEREANFCIFNPDEVGGGNHLTYSYNLMFYPIYGFAKLCKLKNDRVQDLANNAKNNNIYKLLSGLTDSDYEENVKVLMGRFFSTFKHEKI